VREVAGHHVRDLDAHEAQQAVEPEGDRQVRPPVGPLVDERRQPLLVVGRVEADLVGVAEEDHVDALVLAAAIPSRSSSAVPRRELGVEKRG
jgi:hypothetical protein